MPRCWFRNIVFDKPSADGTHKWLLAMGVDGKNAIETVYIPDKTRGTLCVSSQVGCGLNCTFCSTATQGFNRNPDHCRDHRSGVVAARHLGNVPHQMRRLTNVVMMGMGEPLMNFDNVVRAMSVMRDDLGYGSANKRDPVDLRPGAADRPLVRRERRVAAVSVCRTMRCARPWCRSTRSTRSPS